MKAVDTNIVVRIIMQDDARQTVIAERIVSEGVFVPVTVVMETGWLLSSFYRQGRAATANALTRLLDMTTIHVADEPRLRRSIELFRAGADLADAIHLAAAGDSEAFVTFDRDLAKLRGMPIRIELAG